MSPCPTPPPLNVVSEFRSCPSCPPIFVKINTPKSISGRRRLVFTYKLQPVMEGRNSRKLSRSWSRDLRGSLLTACLSMVCSPLVFKYLRTCQAQHYNRGLAPPTFNCQSRKGSILLKKIAQLRFPLLRYIQVCVKLSKTNQYRPPCLYNKNFTN